MTNSLDLFPQFVICLCGLCGFATGLFRIELVVDSMSALLPLLFFSFLGSHLSFSICIYTQGKGYVPSPGTRFAYLARVVVATWWQ